MSDPIAFESREAKVTKDIEAEVEKIRAMPKFDLPAPDAPIVGHLVKKIEGSYDVARAKKDTDNAIDLLYIAYNATPQGSADIRVKISDLMTKLIKSQQDSERVMKSAARTAENIIKDLKDNIPDWRDIKEANKPDEFKTFVTSDLLKLTNKIKTKALGIRDDLQKIAKSYDAIIAETVAATANSEKALGSKLIEKAALEKEIREADAKREQLESLVADLQLHVAKFEKMARDYEQRAETAEQRAFIMSIVQVGAQVLSAALPVIAMAATGGGSLLAASAFGTISQAGAKKEPAAAATATTPAATEDNTAEAIKTRKDISEKAAAKKAADDKVAALKKKIRDLEAEKEKEEAKPDGEEGASGATRAAAVAAVVKRLDEAKADLKAEEDKSANLAAAITGLQNALDKLNKGLGKLSEEQQKQAASLRDLQMKMLDKVEKYEQEKRTQTAELVKIKALLKGQRTEEETIQLTIKSLNLSISALKRTKEIVEEIAFFFKSFADFMDQIANEATRQVETIDSVAGRSTLRKNFLENLIKSVDEFFIRQAGEWNATKIVTEKFVQNFAEGWSKLNKLSGKYITGDELAAYLQTASAKLTEIAEDRDDAARRKLANLETYRERIKASVAK